MILTSKSTLAIGLESTEQCYESLYLFELNSEKQPPSIEHALSQFTVHLRGLVVVMTPFAFSNSVSMSLAKYLASKVHQPSYEG